MTVDIWSDIVCPWCYIGKRRFESALAGFAHRDDVAIRWHSFQLDPGAPRTGTETPVEMLVRRKGIAPEQARAMNDHVTAIAAGEGLEYHLDRAVVVNSFDAHRLIHLAARHGRQDAAKERLLRAYFTEGRSIGDHDVLVAIAAELDLPDDEVRAMLAGDAHASEVRDDLRAARDIGIQGVPFFVIDGRYGVSGAQPVEVFAGALERAWSERAGVTMIEGNGEACDDDGCAI